jgi:adenylate cyclase
VERERRKLAAILAADAVGYSRLMGRDESGTLARLREHRKQRFEPTLARHGGRLVKLTGDGALAEFPSAVDALGAAIEFQQAMAEANRDQPEGTRIVFRIGLHLGDLIVDGDDLYGDGVNVAARLEGQAPAGGIVISRTVHEAVEGRLKASFHDLGDLVLKNIERPVRAYRAEWDAVDWPTAGSGEAVPAVVPAAFGTALDLSLPDKPSIAVLPFTNMSGDPEQEYFTDGITEDIITELSRFHSLFVIARNSSFTYKGRAVDVRTVGSEMGVRYVLEGSCRKASARVRVTAQLIDALNGNHIWAERYDRDLDDIFTLQEQLTRSIVAAIAPQVEAAELALSRRVRPRNIQSYELALRARAHATDALSNASRESRHAAIATAEAALQMDPNCQLALTTLAWLHWQQAWFWTGSSMKESLASAYEAANRAIALDPSHHEPHAHKSFCLTVAREYDEALSEAHLATELNPNAADAMQALGAAQMISGSPEEGIESLLQALRLNPRDPAHFITYCYLSISYFLSGDYPKAVEWGRKSKRAAPNYAIGVGALAQALAGDGQLDAARIEIEALRKLAPDFLQARLDGNSPFALAEHRERQVRLVRLAAGEAEINHPKL